MVWYDMVWYGVEYRRMEWSTVQCHAGVWSRVEYSRVEWSRVQQSRLDLRRVEKSRVEWSVKAKKKEIDEEICRRMFQFHSFTFCFDVS